MSPAEKNARRLIALAQHFPSGATSDELRGEFEKVTALAGPAFYEALRYAKEQRWLVLRLDNDRLVYSVDSQAVPLEEPPDEDLPDWSPGSNANGVAVSSLVQIVGDNTASTRQRIRAAATILGYKVHDDGVTEFVKRFLESVCASADIPTDHRIEAGELLRRSEDVKIMPAIERHLLVLTLPWSRRSRSWSYWSDVGRVRIGWSAKWHYSWLRNAPASSSATVINGYGDDFVAPPGWPPWS